MLRRTQRRSGAGRGRRAEGSSGRGEAGFTLVELVVAVGILGLVMTAITAAILVSVKSAAETDRRIGGSRDLQFASAYFSHDAASASSFEASGSPKCGSGNLVVQFIGADFDDAEAVRTHVVSYVWIDVTAPDSSLSRQIHRLSCTVPGTDPAYPLTPDTDITVARRLATGAVPEVACADAADAVVACANADAVTVTVTVTEIDSGDNFSVSGTRRTS